MLDPTTRRVMPRRLKLLAAMAATSAIGVYLPIMTGSASATSQGSKVVFVCAPNLCVTDGAGGNRRQLTTDGVGSEDYASPSLSRDGSRMTFRRANGSAYAADGNAAGARLLGPTDLPALWPRLSPDGTKVTWTAIYRGSTTYIVVASFDGSTPPVGYGTFGGEAGFGPGGQFICPQVDKNQLWISPTLQGSDGGACRNSPPATMVANDPDIHAFFGLRPEYAPDNSLIVDAVTPGGQTSSAGIFLYDPATTQLARQLTNTPGDTNATWSPDGAWIYFDRGADIYRVPSSGGTANLFIAGGTQATASFDATATGGDTSPPTSTITTPADGARYPQNQVVDAGYSCTDPDGAADVATCAGTVASGSPIDTSTVGSHTFTVNATDHAGNKSAQTVHYTVALAGGQGTGGTPSPCCTTASALAALAPSQASGLAHDLAGRIRSLTKPLKLSGRYGEQLMVALYRPHRHGHARGAVAASNKLGTLLATDRESFSSTGHATIHLTMLPAGKKLLKHPSRVRLTLVLVLRDAHRHEFKYVTHVTLHG